jgi:hypothetical protein
MRNLKKLLLAAALVAAAVASTPSTVEASVVCDKCIATNDCYACCRCNNIPASECGLMCP